MVLRGGQAAGVSVRPARMDQQLSPGALGAEGAVLAGLDRLYADPYLEEVVSRAAAVAREQARAQGYATGWADGRRAAAEQAKAQREQVQQVTDQTLAQFAARARSSMSALEAACRTHRQAMSSDLAEVGEALADGALQIATWALGRELATVDAEVAEAVRTALRALGTSDVGVVHVNPADLLTLAELGEDALPAGLRLEPDAAVPPGAALAMTADRQVLAHLPSALARARKVLQG